MGDAALQVANHGDVSVGERALHLEGPQLAPACESFAASTWQTNLQGTPDTILTRLHFSGSSLSQVAEVVGAGRSPCSGKGNDRGHTGKPISRKGGIGASTRPLWPEERYCFTLDQKKPRAPV